MYGIWIFICLFTPSQCERVRERLYRASAIIPMEHWWSELGTEHNECVSLEWAEEVNSYTRLAGLGCASISHTARWATSRWWWWWWRWTRREEDSSEWNWCSERRMDVSRWKAKIKITSSRWIRVLFGVRALSRWVEGENFAVFIVPCSVSNGCCRCCGYIHSISSSSSSRREEKSFVLR